MQVVSRVSSFKVEVLSTSFKTSSLSLVRSEIGSATSVSALGRMFRSFSIKLSSNKPKLKALTLNSLILNSSENNLDK